jgi:short subunit dehydrogenase-like uncharacterized protein
MTQPDERYDIIVFGATGFTGQLVAEHLASRRATLPDLTWAIAGRDQAKLDTLAQQLDSSGQLPRLVADATDVDDLERLVRKCKVVITTVGPYQLYGSELVAACAEAGIDYVDLSGEPAWMRQMIDAHHAKATATGARIVLSCGFDSIPFDLGVFVLQQAAIARSGAPCSEIKTRVTKMDAFPSGGTVASVKATIGSMQRDPSIAALLDDPFALTPGFVGPEQPPLSGVQRDEELDVWLAPFMIAPINTKNVHRSNMLMDHRYGADFRYSEMRVAGRGDEGHARAEEILNDRSIMSPDAPKPGEGPSREVRESGSYEAVFGGTLSDGEQIRVVVTGEGDPGYGSTSKMIAEAAICLACDITDTAGGVLTPSVAMGEALVRRLEDNAGLTFSVQP